MIVHLRVVPDFGLAVEERDRPSLRSQPAILGGLPHERGAVREVNGPAQYRGVRVGMTLSQAQQQCPEGIFLPPDPPRYRVVWEEICSILQSYTPLVEPVELGQAFLDLPDASLLEEIVAQIGSQAGMTPWLGAASARVVAELASQQEGITVVAAGQEAAFLADLPITLLPGVEARLALTFHVLGITTIGQFAALPSAAVRRRFGTAGERLHSHARGIDPRPVSPPPPMPAVTARHECDEGALEEIHAVLPRLAATIAEELQRRDLAGRLITLHLVWEETSCSPGNSVRASCIRPRTDVATSLLGNQETEPSGKNRDHRKNRPERLQDAPTGDGRSAVVAPKGKAALLVPYRIHSMLPQPPAETSLHPSTTGVASLPQDEAPHPIDWRQPGKSAPSDRFTTMVRTPLTEATPLAERAQKLLVDHWPGNGERRLQAVELTVSQFEPPIQLTLAGLGRPVGMDPIRLQALTQQEGALEARYGDTSLRHAASLDPAGLLAERRFRWAHGLPWRRS